MFDITSYDMLTGQETTGIDHVYNSSCEVTGFITHPMNGFANHYDSLNQFTGHDQLCGNQVNHFDSNNQLTGHSELNIFGGTTHYDANNSVTGYDQIFGDTIKHYDSNHNLIGSSDQNGNSFNQFGQQISKFKSIF